jgi:orotate phosphoribosyltransferase
MRGDYFVREDVLQSLKFGDFTLSSGSKSSYYFDLEGVFCQFGSLETIREALFEQMKPVVAPLLEQQKIKCYILAGPAMGAVPLMVSLGSHHMEFNNYIIVDKLGSFRSAHPKVIRKFPVILVDDVFETGASLKRTIDACKRLVCVEEFIAAFVVVNRNKEVSDKFEVPVHQLFMADELVQEAKRRQK